MYIVRCAYVYIMCVRNIKIQHVTGLTNVKQSMKQSATRLLIGGAGTVDFTASAAINFRLLEPAWQGGALLVIW